MWRLVRQTTNQRAPAMLTSLQTTRLFDFTNSEIWPSRKLVCRLRSTCSCSLVTSFPSSCSTFHELTFQSNGRRSAPTRWLFEVKLAFWLEAGASDGCTPCDAGFSACRRTGRFALKCDAVQHASPEAGRKIPEAVMMVLASRLQVCAWNDFRFRRRRRYRRFFPAIGSWSSGRILPLAPGTVSALRISHGCTAWDLPGLTTPTHGFVRIVRSITKHRNCGIGCSLSTSSFVTGSTS